MFGIEPYDNSSVVAFIITIAKSIQEKLLYTHACTHSELALCVTWSHLEASSKRLPFTFFENPSHSSGLGESAWPLQRPLYKQPSLCAVKGPPFFCMLCANNCFLASLTFVLLLVCRASRYIHLWTLPPRGTFQPQCKKKTKQ